jgi:AcrR family transcriptional regulator
MATRMSPDERRASLLDMAGAVFAVREYANASVSDVAALAGVSEALVFRYFPTKAALHSAVLRSWARDLSARMDAADVPDAPTRERVSTVLQVLLDDADDGARWWLDASSFPSESVSVVAEARDGLVARLRDLRPPRWARDDYALAAWPGMVEAAVRAWTARGCPPDERGHVTESTLGALEGALGDWA